MCTGRKEEKGQMGDLCRDDERGDLLVVHS